MLTLDPTLEDSTSQPSTPLTSTLTLSLLAEPSSARISITKGGTCSGLDLSPSERLLRCSSSTLIRAYLFNSGLPCYSDGKPANLFHFSAVRPTSSYPLAPVRMLVANRVHTRTRVRRQPASLERSLTSSTAMVLLRTLPPSQIMSVSQA